MSVEEMLYTGSQFTIQSFMRFLCSDLGKEQGGFRKKKNSVNMTATVKLLTREYLLREEVTM